MVEADAERIEDAFVASYDAQEAAEYARLERESGAEALTALEDVPPILLEFVLSPYVLGPPMLRALIAVGGEAAVDAAFHAPPSSDEHVIDVSAFLAGDLPVEVRPPALRDGERELSRDEFGMLSLLLMLGERLGFEDAWRAADGWGGAAFLSFRRGAADCVRIAVAGDTPEDLDELIDAFIPLGSDHAGRGGRKRRRPRHHHVLRSGRRLRSARESRRHADLRHAVPARIHRSQ